MIWFRLAYREILNNKKFSLFFIFNISFGIVGIIALGSMQESFKTVLDSRSKSMLSADLAVSARRPLTPQETEIVDNQLGAESQKQLLVESYSMLARGEQSKLVQIRGIEPNYPFYGSLKLRQAGEVIGTSQKESLRGRKIWIFSELSDQLDLKVGEQVKLGNLNFEVADIVDQDPTEVWTGASMAPLVYMNLDELKSTGLIRQGSTAYYSALYKLSDPIANNDKALESYLDSLFSSLQDPAVRVTSHKNASEQMSRMFRYLNDYLGLITLIALFLACLGSAFLFQAHLLKKINEIAVIITLGGPLKKARSVFLYQLLILGLAAGVFSLLLTFFLMPSFEKIIGQYFNFQVQLSISLTTLILSLVSGIVASLMLCWPLLRNIDFQTLTQALQNQAKSNPMRWSQVIYWAPSLLTFLALAMWQAKSFYIGLAFTLSFLLSFFLIGGAGYLFIRIIQSRLFHSLFLKLSLRHLYREPQSTVTLLSVMGLIGLLINLIPQLQMNLQKELSIPDKTPSLFLFDIQEDQVQPLTQFFAENYQLDFMQNSPMIRARIISVNDKPFEKGDRPDKALTREEERELRFRNRGFNLTYRDKLSPAESVTQGLVYSKAFEGEITSENIPEVSIEERFAGRLNINLQDTLLFDIQGLSVPAKVTSFRKVKWTSFQPNFFIQFQPGVLEQAPKTYVASLPPLSNVTRAKLQNALANQFANISTIDVTRLTDRISGLIGQMSLALSGMAILCLLTGLLVYFSVSHYRAYSRRKDLNIMKILGASAQSIYQFLSLEYLLLSFLAVSTGAVLSLIGSHILLGQIFSIESEIFWKQLFAVCGVLIVIAPFVALISATKIIRSSPQALLSDNQS